LTTVLHTWSQTLLDHYHLHCIVTGGGLSADGSRWTPTPPNYLFAVRALSLVFRGKFCMAGPIVSTGRLSFTKLLHWPSLTFQRLLRQAVRQKWSGYAKRPLRARAKSWPTLPLHRVA
jgi:hypothetical protein